jgi:hypothetical protein
MINDLIKRLLAEETDLTDCAADCIEELGKEITAKNHLFNSVYNGHIKDFTIAEAKLAKAVETLRKLSCKCSSNCDWEHDDICPSWTANATLAELEG